MRNFYYYRKKMQDESHTAMLMKNNIKQKLISHGTFAIKSNVF